MCLFRVDSQQKKHALSNTYFLISSGNAKAGWIAKSMQINAHHYSPALDLSKSRTARFSVELCARRSAFLKQFKLALAFELFWGLTGLKALLKVVKVETD